MRRGERMAPRKKFDLALLPERPDLTFERALWEERAEARAQAFCDGLAADLALIPTPQDADPG